MPTEALRLGLLSDFSTGQARVIPAARVWSMPRRGKDGRPRRCSNLVMGEPSMSGEAITVGRSSWNDWSGRGTQLSPLTMNNYGQHPIDISRYLDDV